MLVASLEAYGIWAATYDSAPNPLLALERRVMKGLLPDVRGKRVVDVACGTGYWTRTLRKAGALVFGFDNCPAMVERGGGGQIFVADALAAAVRSETADLTLCSMGASYFTDLKQAMSEMARITRPRGQVILSDMHPAAMAAGWKRSFGATQHSYHIEHWQWSEEAFHDAALAAGLAPHARFDEAFAEPERALFSAAGREHVFEDVKQVPAIRITTWIRL
jgi:ubiquinone/menaquinone biosynthesis C-methylase UbiE